MTEPVSIEELQLAARNHGMPLEGLRWDVTPVGMHYLLVHYDVPFVDLAGWRLEVDGTVSRPLSLSLGDLRLRETVTRAVTLECAGNGRALLEPRPLSQPWLCEAVGTGEWTGTPLASLLAEAGLRSGAVEILFTGLDRGVEGGVEQNYARSLPLKDALGEGVLLAWGLNGALLPPQHGFPLRLVVPDWYGMASVKWLGRITVLDRPYDGYQNAVAYRYRADDDDPGTPVTRMMPRSLMVPPGLPDFMTRRRILEAGPVTVSGRAWSGLAPIERVEFSADGGATWMPTRVERRQGAHAWAAWTAEWKATPGERLLCSRATDAAGNTQPDEAPWNAGGYANNSIQRIEVTVRP